MSENQLCSGLLVLMAMLVVLRPVLSSRASSIPRHADFHAMRRNSPFAAEKHELPIFATFISTSRFFRLLFNFTIYKPIKSTRCKLWFCALAPSSKLDTRKSACSLRCFLITVIFFSHYDDIFTINCLMWCVFVLQVTINSLYFDVLSVNTAMPTSRRM